MLATICTGTSRSGTAHLQAELPFACVSCPPVYGEQRTGGCRTQGSSPPSRDDRLAGSPPARPRSSPSRRRRTRRAGRGPVPRRAASSAQPRPASIFAAGCLHARRSRTSRRSVGGDMIRLAGSTPTVGSACKDQDKNPARFNQIGTKPPRRWGYPRLSPPGANRADCGAGAVLLRALMCAHPQHVLGPARGSTHSNRTTSRSVDIIPVSCSPQRA